MKTVALLGTCALLLAAAVPARASADPETDQLACDLAGQCDVPTPDAGADPAGTAAVATTPQGARTGAIRGFTFKRQAPTATMAAPTAAPAMASATPRPAAAGRRGMSNLRLNFASGSAVLDDAGKARLAKLAEVLGSPALAARRARIEGHTDAVGSARANIDLSRRRAQSVADYLVDAGVDSGRLDVVGLGAAQPLPGIPAQSAENRRVMAVILN